MLQRWRAGRPRRAGAHRPGLDLGLQRRRRAPADPALDHAAAAARAARRARRPAGGAHHRARRRRCRCARRPRCSATPASSGTSPAAPRTSSTPCARWAALYKELRGAAAHRHRGARRPARRRRPAARGGGAGRLRGRPRLRPARHRTQHDARAGAAPGARPAAPLPRAGARRGRAADLGAGEPARVVGGRARRRGGRQRCAPRDHRPPDAGDRPRSRPSSCTCAKWRAESPA